MPFTISHVAAVLPLRSGRTRVEALPTAPLVIASMVPDLPAVLGATDLRPVTHTGPFALVVDLALTAVLWAAWVLVVRAAVVATVPEVAARWRPVRARRPAALWWLVAAGVGSATHLLWDAFTHSSEGATWFGGFADHQGVFLALQLASSVVGLVVLAAWARRWWRRTPPLGLPVPDRSWASRRLVAAVLVLGVVGGALLRVRYPAAGPDAAARPGLMVGEAVFGMLGGALVAVVALTAAFWLQRWRSGLASGPAAAVEQERVGR